MPRLKPRLHASYWLSPSFIPPRSPVRSRDWLRVAAALCCLPPTPSTAFRPLPPLCDSFTTGAAAAAKGVGWQQPRRTPPQKEEEKEEKEEEEKEEEEKEEGAEDPSKGAGDPPAKRVVPGVLYLSFVPPGFGPRHARALLAPHGELGRVFFQPQGGRLRKRRQRPGPPGGSFSEAWVEFRDKRAAKRAAKVLHGTPLSPRPRSPFRHYCWSLKYLPGFRWPHLSERLASERQGRSQRLRAEVAQARRVGGFYADHAPSSRTRPAPAGDKAPPPTWSFSQRRTETERRGGEAPPPPHPLLMKVFGGGA
ncbi:activator of basal transcription 1 [Melanerpes formicivorus]|uniref:activator of basal transcription 1 n=1 Tax=Melanerpes formicivorus TaxID=211600 RepID=UPI00358DF6AD